MSASYITCPNCGWEDKIDDSMLGKKLKCPKCATSFLAEVGGSYDLALPPDAPRSAKPRVPVTPKDPRSAPPEPAPGAGHEEGDTEWKSWLEAWPE